MNTPSLVERFTYICGKRLPEKYNEWVTNDLTGAAAARRMVIRALIPCLLLVAPFLLIPADPITHISVAVSLVLPYIYFTVALNRVFRRSRMRQHGLDEGLVDIAANQKDADEHDRYRLRHGHQ